MARLENFDPTRKEKEAINTAYNWIEENAARDSYTSKKFMQMEHKGYGNVNDRIPLLAAKGICVKFFMEGVEEPDMLLREQYDKRLAYLWFAGLGAKWRHEEKALPYDILVNGLQAWNDAFNRMHS